MGKKLSKKSDINTAAFLVVQKVTEAAHEPANEGKNPAAVMLGKMGGLKGGKARAAKLSPKERSAIAKKAAIARWCTQE